MNKTQNHLEKSVYSGKKGILELIEESSKFEQAEWLIEELVQKGLEEVVGFEFIVQELMNASYQLRLWGAALANSARHCSL